MNIPSETKPVIMGAVGGALAMAFIGFTWGGWVTGTKAEAAALDRVNTAVVTALAPICVEKFKRANEHVANLAALKNTDAWSRGEYVAKGGWVETTGEITPERKVLVANACALLLIES